MSRIEIAKKINSFNKKIYVSGDKSLSIRWVLFSSIAKGKSKAYNLKVLLFELLKLLLNYSFSSF